MSWKRGKCTEAQQEEVYEHTYELLFLTCCTPRRNAVGVLPNSNHGKTANFIGSCYETTNKLRTSSQVQVGFQKLM